MHDETIALARELVEATILDEAICLSGDANSLVSAQRISEYGELLGRIRIAQKTRDERLAINDMQRVEDVALAHVEGDLDGSIPEWSALAMKGRTLLAAVRS